MQKTPEEIAKELWETQSKVNELIHPEWFLQGYNWDAAMMVEAAELIDHLGYAWWKKQEPNREQAAIEVIDILHFWISKIIENHNLAVDAYEHTNPHTKLLTHNCPPDGTNFSQVHISDIPTLIESVVLDRGGITASLHDLLSWYCTCLGEYRTLAQFAEAYQRKALLNILRQKQGYAKGEYRKRWGLVEDNEATTRLPYENPEQYYQLLEEAYLNITKEEV